MLTRFSTRRRLSRRLKREPQGWCWNGSDELDLAVNVDHPCPALSVVELARAFATKSLDNPNVRFFLERKVEALALARA